MTWRETESLRRKLSPESWGKKTFVTRDRTGIDLTNTVVYWNAELGGDGDATLVEWPHACRRGRHGYSSWGACNAEIQQASFELRKSALFINAYQILQDGINPDLLHRVLMPLDEYRGGLADDRLWFYAQC